MKFRTAVVVCMTLLLLAATGAEAKSMTFGLKGGVDLAQFKYDPEIDTTALERRMGFGGGLTLGFALFPALSFDVDGMYMMKVAHWEGTSFGDQVVKQDWKFDYAIVSPVLRLRMPGQSVAPYVLGGGEVGYLVSAKVETSGAADDMDVKDDHESLDYGFVLGAGVEIPNLSGGGFFFEARYSRGLAAIAKDVENGDQTLVDEVELKTMNEALYFLAGIRF